MNIRYQEFGICGLPCQLCATYHADSVNRCEGCKSRIRQKKGCDFIVCALRKKGVEFCWDCNEASTCVKWNTLRVKAKTSDHCAKCSHQMLEADLAQFGEINIERFRKLKDMRNKFLIEMLTNFNDGKSKTYYCVACTVIEIDELREALITANKRVSLKEKNESRNLNVKEKAEIMHTILDELAADKNYILRIRQ